MDAASKTTQPQAATQMSECSSLATEAPEIVRPLTILSVVVQKSCPSPRALLNPHNKFMSTTNTIRRLASVEEELARYLLFSLTSSPILYVILWGDKSILTFTFSMAFEKNGTDIALLHRIASSA